MASARKPTVFMTSATIGVPSNVAALPGPGPRRDGTEHDERQHRRLPRPE
jgi:hypothetical protein